MKNAQLYKKWFFILAFPIIIACLSFDSWKELDLGSFKISIPTDWKYKQQQGEDSFIGEIKGPKCSLSFDYSNNGYANSLIPTEQQYLQSNQWNQGYFYKPGVTYTADFNVKNERAAQMKKLGTTDSTKVHVEADPSYQTKIKIRRPTADQKSKFPKADYIAEMTFKDSTIYVPIEIPPAVKYHYIQIDTTDKYIIKTIWPKMSSKGLTGIYVKSRSTRMNFKLSGINLSPRDQELALQSFKTIKFRD